MASIDSVSITILFGAVLVLAGIMSSLVALRFGAPLLLVFLLVGMLAGESGIGGIKFDDVRLAYTVGSVALGLILFDGGLRTRLATFRNVLAPAGLLATVGVLITAALTAPVAVWALQLELERGAAGRRRDGLDRRRGGVLPAPRQGAAAAPARQRDARGRVRHQRSVRDLPHHRPGRDPVLRPANPGATSPRCWPRRRSSAASSAGSAAAPWSLVLNRLELPQGMHAPFVATGALVTFGLAECAARLGLPRGLCRRA